MVRRLVVFTFIAALAVFCVVQDRVTAAGATEYGQRALASLARHEPVTPVDAIMQPAIRRSVRLGLVSSFGVLIVGLGAAASLNRRSTGRISPSTGRGEPGRSGRE